MISTSCNEKKSNYTIYWQENNLCVVMPHPTKGIVSPGLIDWRGVELSDVLEDIYNEFQKTNMSGNVLVWVRFEMPEHDKYGNETMSYDDHLVATIPISEGKKYKSSKYLDMEYNLTNLFVQSAFPTNVCSPYGTSMPPQNIYPNTTNQTTPASNNYIETDHNIIENAKRTMIDLDSI